MKLGELLIHKKLIDEAQLRQGLQSQLIYGGHLGTCLIELGYLHEEALGEVLSESFGVDYAAPALLLDVPRYVIATIPDKLAEKHLAIPFRLENKVLDVAMANPKDLSALDELSFAAGSRLRPWVSPEVRLYQALERYYDIPRRLRYVSLCKQIDADQPGDPAREVQRKLAPLAMAAGGRDLDEGPRAAAAGPAPEPASSTRNATAVLERPSADALAVVSQQLLQATSRDRLAEIVLAHVSRSLAHAVLFKVRGSTATVWHAAPGMLDARRAASLQFDVVSEPIFELLEGDDLYRGPFPDAAVYLRFIETLGLAPPAEALLLPVHLDDRLVAFFYGDNGDGRIPGESADWRRLARKLSLALEMVLLQRRIVSV